MNPINSLYIHFPFCRHQCNYCDFYKKVPQSKEELNGFHQFMKESYDEHQKLLEKYNYKWGALETLYIGGGTPSMWGADGVKFLEHFFKSCGIRIAKGCEFTLEVNPGSYRKEELDMWRDLGVNRYSLGIQSYNDKFLSVLDRIHDLQAVTETLDFFASSGYNYSVDFMLGLPFSREKGRDVISELDSIMGYRPQHISLYILSVGKGYVHFDNLAAEEWIEREYLAVSDYLRERGFSHYEVSNFALPSFESNHNLRYWRGETVAALGPSATGFLAPSGVRYKWSVNIPSFKEEVLSPEESALERLYLGLRTTSGVDLGDFYRGDELTQIRRLAEEWEQRSMAMIDGYHLRLTPKGYLMLDSFMDGAFGRVS